MPFTQTKNRAIAGFPSTGLLPICEIIPWNGFLRYHYLSLFPSSHPLERGLIVSFDDSIVFRRIPQDSLRIPQDVLRFFRIPLDFPGLLRIPYDSSGFLWISQGFLREP